MNRHINLPPTAAGTKLSLPQDVLDGYKPVYKKHDDNGYIFQCDYNPDIDYGEKCIIVLITSVFQDVETQNPGEAFANILGSSYDLNHPRWHDLANRNHVVWAFHEENTIYDCYNTSIGYTSIGSGRIIGGHVVKGTMPIALNTGDSFYIVPIAQNHNSMKIPHIVSGKDVTPGNGNGNGFYMKMSGTSDRKAMKMTGYLTYAPQGAARNN